MTARLSHGHGNRFEVHAGVATRRKSHGVDWRIEVHHILRLAASAEESLTRCAQFIAPPQATKRSAESGWEAGFELVDQAEAHLRLRKKAQPLSLLRCHRVLETRDRSRQYEYVV